MRGLLRSAVVLIAMFILFSMTVAEDKPWFDMEKCELCKPFMEVPGLMMSMEYEQYELENGIVTISRVSEGSLPAYREAVAKMMAKIEKLEQGEQMYLCGMCTAHGELLMKGAKMEYIETEHGDLTLITSTDPELAAEIKAFAKRSQDEWKKMEAMMPHTGEKGHEGHDHDKDHEGQDD
jgi:hypothetical protein